MALKIVISAAALAIVGFLVVAFVLLYQAVGDLETAVTRPVTVANPVETVTVANPVDEVKVANPVDTVTVANPVETVTIANPVETVTVANPVDTVTIANPVDEVKITNVVETSSPRDSSLWGYCFPTQDSDGYEINVVAFSGGIEKTVAAGTYANADAASSIALQISDYYYNGVLELDFGRSSERCGHLDGWAGS